MGKNIFPVKGITSNQVSLSVPGLSLSVENANVIELPEIFQQIIEQSPSGIFSVDRQYRYTSFNQKHAQKMESLFGAKIKLGQSILSYQGLSGDSEIAKANFNRVFQGESFIVESFFDDKSMGRKYFEISHSPLRNKFREVMGAIVMVQDVTLRQVLETKLLDAKQQVTEILDSITDGFATLDHKMVVTYFNAEAERVLHISRSKVLGKPLLDVFPRMKDYVFYAKFLSALKSKKPVSFEIDADHSPDKNWYDVRVYPHAKGISVFFQLITEHRQTEESLRLIMEDLNQFVSQSGDLFCISDSDGYFHRLNPQWGKVLGYTLENLANHKFIDFIHPDDVSATLKVLEQLKTQKKVHNFVNRFRTQSGEYRWFEWNSIPSGKYFYAVARDISVRLEQERQIKEKEERYRKLFDTMTEIVAIHEVITDVQGKVINYRILDVNPAYTKNLGIPAERAIGKLATEVYGTAIPPYLELFGSVAQTGNPVEYETYFEPMDKHFHIFVFSPGPGIFVTVTTDFTDIKRGEEKYKQLAEKWQTTFNAVSDAIWLLDENGTIQQCNHVTKSIFNLLPEDIIGKRCYEVVHGSDIPLHDCPLVKMRKSNQRETTEIQAGSRYLSITVDPIFNDRQELTGVVHIASDITARQQAEDARIVLETQMQHTQKLESLGVLAGGIAHDFNNLLMTIMGNVDLALLDISPASPIKDNLTEIQRATHHASDLCRQMLAYSGKGCFELLPLSINELVSEMAHMLEISISKKAILKYHFAANQPAVKVDPTQVRQVIMNLIINASEAIGEKSGVISVSTGIMECDQAYLVDLFLADQITEGTYVYLEVADNGIGMSRDVLNKIFDPFFTTKFTGRGLGLAAVMGIIKTHGGAIKVYSEPGKGTTFKVLLPALEESVVSRKTQSESDVTWRGQGTILLVDDDVSVRTIGKRILERMGFDVLLADDGLKGLTIFRQHMHDIKLVILDLTMPHMDGEETFREMRRIRNDVKVILSSGYTEQDVVQRFVGKGLAGFIQKPYKLEAIRDKLKQILG